MKKFENREGINLNKKILIVEEVNKNEFGEITSLEVEEVRNDQEGLTKEGTALSAENLNEIIISMIDEELKACFKNNSSVKVSIDKEKLTIPSEYLENYQLPTKGQFGSTITWNKVAGSENIIVQSNNLICIRNETNHAALINAEIRAGLVTDSKEFFVEVPPIEIDNYNYVYNYTIGESWSSRVISENIESDVDVVITNNGNYLNATTAVDLSTQKVNITITQGIPLTSIGSYSDVLLIEILAKNTQNILKTIHVSLICLESTSPED